MGVPSPCGCAFDSGCVCGCACVYAHAPPDASAWWLVEAAERASTAANTRIGGGRYLRGCVVARQLRFGEEVTVARITLTYLSPSKGTRSRLDLLIYKIRLYYSSGQEIDRISLWKFPYVAKVVRSRSPEWLRIFGRKSLRLRPTRCSDCLRNFGGQLREF